MAASDLSRRSFLFYGAVAANSAALTTPAFAAPRVPVSHPRSPAGASGSLWIGGDWQVNRIGLGTTEFTGTTGVLSTDPATIRKLLRRALELGVNLLDTADNYGAGFDALGVDHPVGTCERFVYEALYPYP